MGNKKLRYAMTKTEQESSWNEPYSSSFTKLSCSKMASYRWIKTESRYGFKATCLQFRTKLASFL